MKGFGYLLKEGFRNVWSNRIMSIASICVLVSCLVLTGAATLLSRNVSDMVESVGQNNETTVYIKDGYSQLEAVYIGKDIEKIDNVQSATFYSRDEAFKKYREQLGDELFAQIEQRNPLPDAFIVVMDDLSLYENTVEQIQKIEGVSTIVNRSAFADKLTKLSHLVNMISFGIVLALVIISIFIIANTIRATMYSRRFEISIMKSVGATNMFVRMPFLVEGMAIGFISAALATGALYALYEAVIAVVESTNLPLNFIPFSSVLIPIAIAFVIAGVVVGFFGGFISIRKYLKMEGNEILGW
ncbi:MAG: permease-like cell division protein FtsX [Ruminococcus sp.]|nr:permease-like cell division protein FtsX [Ruminococcus sp.]